DNYGERLDEFIERLAEHALKGEAWESAVTYHVKAGERAIGRSAHREAILFFERALTALGHLPSDREHIDRAITVRLGLRIALGAGGELVEIRRCLDGGAALAEAINDRAPLPPINTRPSLAPHQPRHFGQAGATRPRG